MKEACCIRARKLRVTISSQRNLRAGEQATVFIALRMDYQFSVQNLNVKYPLKRVEKWNAVLIMSTRLARFAL